MAYRRRHAMTRASTFKEEIYHDRPNHTDARHYHDDNDNDVVVSPSCLAARAVVKASPDHRDSSFYSYGYSDVVSTSSKLHEPRSSSGGGDGKMENARPRMGLDELTSCLNHIGDNTKGNAWEEGRSTAENKTADIIQQPRELQSRWKGVTSEMQNQSFDLQKSSHGRGTQPLQVPAQTNIKATRDVAVATAAKAKLLLRELKTMKADLAFAKERCAQLEEENRRLRESREKGANTNADDDLIRLQLETLLAEKARLAHENAVYARENRFLREIVEYHQLTMQDLVYLDEGSEEVAEVYPFSVEYAKGLSSIPTSPTSPISLPYIPPSSCQPEVKDGTAETNPCGRTP